MNNLWQNHRCFSQQTKKRRVMQKSYRELQHLREELEEALSDCKESERKKLSDKLRGVLKQLRQYEEERLI